LQVRIGIEQVVGDVFHDGFERAAGHVLHVGLGIADRRLRQHVLARDRLVRQHRGAPAKTRRQRDLHVERLPQRVADHLIHRPDEIAAPV
jgi:hypothetical protein